MSFAKNIFKKLLRTLPKDKLTFLSEFFFTAHNKINDQIRWKSARHQSLPRIVSFDGKETLDGCIIEDTTPWKELSPDHGDTPGMISPEECRYYKYISRFYSGKGDVIELGPWLGRSTNCIVQGLTANPNFQGRKLHVFDDFVWRAEWMNPKVPPSQQLAEGQDFQFLFESYTGRLKESMTVQKRGIYTSDENGEVPRLEWTGGPVEMMFVDCGRTFEGNDVWFRLFSRFFIPDATLLILQDWCTHREVPVQWYNQIKQFVDSKGSSMQPVHELKFGCVATFLYRSSSI